MVTAWASNLAAPVAEATLPRRNMAAAISGATSGVERTELGVEALHPGVAVGGALLGVAMDLTDRVIDVEERQPLIVLGAGDQPWDLGGESGQNPGADRVELLDMAVGERPQVGPERRGCPYPAEEKRRSMPP